MEIYQTGAPIAISVLLVGGDGAQILAETAHYSLSVDGGETLAESVPVTGFSMGDGAVYVQIPAELNQMSPSTPVGSREVRLLTVVLGTSDGPVTIRRFFALEPPESLIVAVNSFQTLRQAELTAMDIPDLVGWANSDDRQKQAALIEGHTRISLLNFSLSAKTEGFNITDLTPAQYTALDAKFRTALNKAQVVEANALLGGNDVEDRRREGLMLDSVGETKQMWRSGRPVDMPCSRRALRYLAPYIGFAKRIGRG